MKDIELREALRAGEIVRFLGSGVKGSVSGWCGDTLSDRIGKLEDVNKLYVSSGAYYHAYECRETTSVKEALEAIINHLGITLVVEGPTSKRIVVTGSKESAKAKGKKK